MARPPGDDAQDDVKDSGSLPLSEPQREAVTRALKAAISSDHISGSKQLCDFLTYIVTKSLAGESDDIKAYSIAVDALGRDESFDPQNSATVRVAAGRLRQALALHNVQFDGADKTDGTLQAVINLEPGSYIPNFAFIDPTTRPDAAADQSMTTPELSEQNATGTIRDDVSTAPSAQSSAIKPVVPWLVLPVIGALIAVLSLLAWMAVLPNQPQVADAPGTAIIEQELPQGSERDASARPRIKTTLITPSETYPEWFSPQEAKDAIIVTAVRFDDYEFVGGALVDRPIADDDRNADFHLQVTLYAAGDDVRGYAQLARADTGAIVWTRLEVFERPMNPPIRNMEDLAGRRIAPLLSPYAVVQSDMVRTAPNR
ncbi:MAG: hypothetical protein AAF764_04810, partial [Pseudomonadota bacterium]